MAEGARLESVYTFTGIGGSNPSLSARFFQGTVMDFLESRMLESAFARCGSPSQILELYPGGFGHDHCGKPSLIVVNQRDPVGGARLP